MTYSLIYLEYS